ncbi:hypothetical protein COE57_27860 [Bacillus cereus]|nr:hypothetical protein COE57_27860 [Bacillus cereus]
MDSFLLMYPMRKHFIHKSYKSSFIFDIKPNQKIKETKPINYDFLFEGKRFRSVKASYDRGFL